MNIYQKFLDMIINTSELFQNISEGRLTIFTALFDGLVPKIGLPKLFEISNAITLARNNIFHSKKVPDINITLYQKQLKK